ncbi:MAG: hypothetical protein ACM3P1_09220 [Candidatus Saccharibacteria bacterium]
MARIKTNIGDQVSGKMRNMVFYQMNGKSYVRSAPITNEDTWNEEQRMRRKRIVKVSELWRALKTEQFSLIWNTAAQQMNGYAWYVKANMPALEMDGTVIDARLLKLSDGKLAIDPMLSANVIEEAPATIKVNWQNDPHIKGERLKDELMVISYDGEKFSAITSTGLKRKDLQGTIALPVKPANAGYIYLFFAAEDRRSFSESRGFKV